MRKFILVLLGCLLAAFNVFSTEILWVGISETASIGNSGMTVQSWLNALSDLDAASFRIRIGNTILPDIYGNEYGWIGYPGSGYIYPGQK